jgi:hypothetical protein
LQTNHALNGTDTINDFTIGDGDLLNFDFGKAGGLANQEALRGSGRFYERLTAGSALGANTGFIISNTAIGDAAAAQAFAQGLVGAQAGDISYLVGSTNPAGVGAASVYRIDYTGANAATISTLATLGNIDIRNIVQANIPQFNAATAQTQFAQIVIQPGNRVQLGNYWPNADGQFGTIAGYDEITNFSATDGTKQILQLPGNAYIAPVVTNFDGLDSGLTFRGNANWTHTISSSGKFTGNHPIEGDNHAAMMIDYLSHNDIGDAGATVFFTTNYTAAVRGSINHTWVYTQTSNSRGRVPVVGGNPASQNVYDGGFTVVDLIGSTLQGLETIPSGNNNFAYIS